MPKIDSKTLKEKIAHETKKYLLYTLILVVFFNAFSLYRALTLKEYGIDIGLVGFNIIQSMVLAKVIVIGEVFGLGERYKGQPLFMVTLYKTVVFLIFVLLFAIIEHFTIDAFHGKSFDESLQVFLDYRLYQLLASIVVMSFFFVLFFAFMELGKAMGNNRLYNMFFKSTNKQ